MWFKNALVYRIENFNINAMELDENLKPRKFIPCMPTQEKSAGWISPFGDSNKVMAHGISKTVLFCIKTEEKNLPASVVNEEARKRIDEWRDRNDGKRVPKDIRESIKDQIHVELLPKAFPKYNRIFAYIDTINNLLVIDTSSRNKAEGLILLLKASIEDDSFNTIAFYTENDPSTSMSSWISGEDLPTKFEIGGRCSLRDKNESGTIKYNKQCLDDNNLCDYLKTGKTVSELEFVWEEKMQFVLNEDLVVKSIKYLDILTDQINEITVEDEYALMDAEFSIMSAGMSELYLYIVTSFGGSSEPPSVEEMGIP